MTYNLGLMSLAMAKNGWLDGDEEAILQSTLDRLEPQWAETKVIDFDIGLLRLSQAPLTDARFFDLIYDAALRADFFFYDPRDDAVYTVTEEQASCLQAAGQFAVFRSSAAEIFDAFQK